jgi:DNA-directed RNA polymerase specialized sigma24 family protein
MHAQLNQMDPTRVTFPEDLALARHILSGDQSAAQLFANNYSSYLEAFLLRKTTDARSSEKARDIASDVIGDCFRNRRGETDRSSILEFYEGRASLKGWLATVALSRLKNWWRSAEFRLTIGEVEGVDLIESFSNDSDLKSDQDAVEMIRVALEQGLRALRTEEIVFLRLVFLFKIRRERIAEMWGCHPSTVGRMLTDAATRVRETTQRHLRLLDPYFEITWEDLIEVCSKHGSIIQGE